MSLDVQRYHDKQATVLRGGGDFFRLVDGKNAIRIFTFEHKVTKHDFQIGTYVADLPRAPKVGDTVTELDRERQVHFTADGPRNCTRKDDCEFCQEASVALASKRRTDQEWGKRLSVTRRYVINCVDMSDMKAGMKQLEMPPSVYHDVLGFLTSGEYEPEELFGVGGRDFVITRDSKKPPAQMYSIVLRDADKSKALPKKLEKDAKDFLSNKSLDPGADPEEETETETTETAESDDTEKFEDEEASEDENTADEEEQEVRNGTAVKFEAESEEHFGNVIGWDAGTYEVETKTDIWNLSRDEFEILETKPRRSKKTAKKTIKKR